MARTLHKNTQTLQLIQELKKLAIARESGFWKRIAVELGKPARNKRVVNLSRIDRHTKENEIVIVPGKVLSSGVLTHKVHVAAESFSDQARAKLIQNGSLALTIPELMQQHPDGKNIRILG